MRLPRLAAARSGPSLAAILVFLIAGCAVEAPPVDGVIAAPTPFADLPGWSSDHLAQALPALRRGCARLTSLPPDQHLGGGTLAAAAAGQAALWLQPCTALRLVPDDDDAAARAYLETWFTPHRLADDPASTALFTGYYEPLVAGATVQGGRFQVPLLARPDDLVRLPPATPNGRPVIRRRTSGGRLIPYYTRAQIEAGALQDQDLAIVWLASRADLFFLQLQGSGRIATPDGQTLRVTYDGSNGQSYVPLGRLLVQRGWLAPGDVSMQSIRAWLAAHPGQADALLDENPAYVFFRQTPDAAGSGPPGALGVPLTPGRSIAVDRAIIPLGVPVFIDTIDPLSSQAWQHLTLAQDLGTDITGAARADIFYGSGPQAERAAGTMHASGNAWILLPRQPQG